MVVTYLSDFDTRERFIVSFVQLSNDDLVPFEIGRSLQKLLNAGPIGFCQGLFRAFENKFGTSSESAHVHLKEPLDYTKHFS